VAAGDHEVPSEVQLSGVLDLFERLRDRPPSWRRERPRPLLFLLGPVRSTFRAAETADKRCAGERAPISRIAGKTGQRDVAGVLREAKRELSRHRCHPRGEPALRFPLLEMALWLRSMRDIHLQNLAHAELEQQGKSVPPNAEDEISPEEQDNHRLARELARAHRDKTRRDMLARMIRRRGRNLPRDPEDVDRGRFAAFLTYLEQVAPIGVVIVAAVSITLANTLDLVAAGVSAGFGLSFVAGQIVARSRGWFAVRRYVWLSRQPYMRRAARGDFLGFALEMAVPPRRDGEEQREQLDRLLVAAFLEDLRRNHHRDIRRAAWARVRYPMLIFDHLSPGHIGCRFIRIVEEVRARSQTERGLSDFDPLVIVAGIDPDAPAYAVDPVDARAPKLVDWLAHSIAVETADETPASMDEAAGLLERRDREQRRLGALGVRREMRVDLTKGHDAEFDRIRPARRRPWATHPALPWVAMCGVLIGTVSWLWHTRTCDPPSVRSVAGGECVGITDGSYHFDARVTGVETAIKKLNDQVLASGKPYVTVVYLGPLTPDPTTKNPEQDLLASAQGELVGLLMAQQRYNAAGPPLRVRILLANAGSKMRYAKRVAQQVRTQALHDRHIVGVVGFEQSRSQTQQAIGEISRGALPMIGTANSFDGTARQGSGFSPYYFRLAPPNSRLAAHAAHWARSGLLDGIHARTVTVFYDGDPADLYSRNLAEDFRGDFGPDKVTVLSYRDPSEVPSMVQQACAHPSDVFYYAGRSDEFRAFINQLTNTACGQGSRVVLADDEIAKYVNDSARQIGGDDAFRLFYTPLALREAWTPKWVGSQPVGRFFSDYDRVVGEVAGPHARPDMRPSPTRAAVSYDAVLMFTSVTSQIFGDQHVQPTPAAVLAALLEPERVAPLQGASGVLTFGSREAGHQVNDKPVLLATVRPNGALEVLAVCGRLVAGGQTPADCPAQDLR
jgi:ABC-type branched-subunit amino acid transport system substrate-binding protein